MLTKTLQVKNGAIILPQDLKRAWKNHVILIERQGNKIIIEGVPAHEKRVDIEAWKKASGIIKHRKIPNPVKWQRQIRKEWERIA